MSFFSCFDECSVAISAAVAPADPAVDLDADDEGPQEMRRNKVLLETDQEGQGLMCVRPWEGNLSNVLTTFSCFHLSFIKFDLLSFQAMCLSPTMRRRMTPPLRKRRCSWNGSMAIVAR